MTMSIKEKSTFKKHELEYQSPDGDIWDIVMVEHEDRKYIQFKRSPAKEYITMDGAMLLDMADAYRKITSKAGTSVKQGQRPFHVPSIVDHRAIEKRGADIQERVDETMRNQDNSIPPIQSFSPAANTPEIVNGDYTEFRTGLKPEEATKEAAQTPDEWSIKKNDEELKPWQKDAKSRGTMHPPLKKAGAIGTDFKRVGARDII